MVFPPAEENLDVPSELIGEGNLFGGEIVAIGGDPVIDVRHPIADQTKFPFRPIDAGGPQKNYGVVKDNAVGLNFIHSETFAQLVCLSVFINQFFTSDFLLQICGYAKLIY